MNKPNKKAQFFAGQAFLIFFALLIIIFIFAIFFSLYKTLSYSSLKQPDESSINLAMTNPDINFIGNALLNTKLSDVNNMNDLKMSENDFVIAHLKYFKMIDDNFDLNDKTYKSTIIEIYQKPYFCDGKDFCGKDNAVACTKDLGDYCHWSLITEFGDFFVIYSDIDYYMFTFKNPDVYQYAVNSPDLVNTMTAECNDGLYECVRFCERKYLALNDFQSPKEYKVCIVSKNLK